MSTEEFMARARGEEWASDDDSTSDDGMTGHRILIDNTGKEVDMNATDYCGLNVEICYKEFLKKYSKADAFEFWCPVVFTVKID